jgi:outer membrane autotransporter protein
MTTWRHVHGGLEWSDLGAHTHHEHFAGHDQAAATREWRYGAGVSFQLTDAMSLEMSYGDLLRGANTHAANTISFGWSWGFQAFGVPRLGDGFK